MSLLTTENTEGTEELFKKMQAYDRITLSRWWRELNGFDWPQDFPMGKPDGWDEMPDRQRMQVGKLAWEALNAAIKVKMEGGE